MSSRSWVFSTDEAPCWWSMDEAKLPHSNIWLVSYKLLIHIDNETLWLDLNPRETSEVWSWWSPFLPPFSGTCCSNETSNSKINVSWYNSDWWLSYTDILSCSNLSPIYPLHPRDFSPFAVASRSSSVLTSRGDRSPSPPPSCRRRCSYLQLLGDQLGRSREGPAQRLGM